MQINIEVYFYVHARPQPSTKQSDPSDDAVWRRIKKAMKITTAIILVAALHVSAASVAQKISFSGENVPLTKVFNAIEDQLGFGVLMPHKLMESSRPVTVRIENGTLNELLQKCFEFQPWKLSYTLTGHTILISESATSAELPKDMPPKKTVKVTGTVYNEAGEPLSGANITIRETERGTITNAKGEFDLGMIPTGSTAIFSFIGYASQEIKISEGGSVRIYLKIAKNELDKVVVQAYGTTTARLTTGSIATITAAEIERQPAMNPLTALEGQVPGLVVTQENGYASAPFKIEIRGRSVIDPSIPSEPLYIIDGVPLTILETGQAGDYASGSVGVTQNGLVGPASGQSPFFSINPQDIESMTVLKDADATAIYGSRGANGVIIITTKRGKPGRTKLEINVYQGESVITQHYSMMNTQQYLMMRREALNNDNLKPTTSNAYDLLTYDTTRYTDYQKAFWGNMGRTTDVQAALSGGNIQTTFRIGGGYHRQTSILTNSGADQRGSVQFNLTHKSIDQRFTLSFTSLYSFSESNLVYSPSAVTLAPDAPAIFSAPGILNWDGWGVRGSQLQSLAGKLFETYVAKTGLLNSEMKLQYDIFRGLHAAIQLGYSTINSSQAQANPIKAQDPQFSPTGTAEFGSNLAVNVIAEPQLVYDQRISKGKLEALAGGTYQGASIAGNTIAGSGYPNDNLLNSIGNAEAKTAYDVSAQYHYAAGFARINYNWEDEYILNLSGRRDGSSRFGPGKQFGNFGAVGAAWIFTQEDWFKKNLNVLSFGKVRGSYGITGMDDIGNYQYISQWTAQGTAPYNGATSFSPTLLANPALQWQTNKKLEAALTLGLLKDRFTMELAWYRNHCGNQLINYNLPYLTGFTQVTANLPALVQNMGWESTVRAKIIDQAKVTWSASFNIGVNRNKLLAFPGLAQSPYASTFVVGMPLNISRYLHYTGVDPLTGQYTFQSRAHNGTINPFVETGVPNDLYNRDMSIKFEGGFGTDLRYKSWQLDIFCRFRGQTLPASLSQDPGTINDNQSTLFLNRWQKPGENARFARFTTEPRVSDALYYGYSDGVLSDGSYIRLQNVSLTYDFQFDWVKKVGIQGCKIYVRGQNIFLLTKYEGIDPDVPSFGGLPPAKVFVAGIQFIF
jgi:TonB-linked SusC/RagA family outer membrane protein